MAPMKTTLVLLATVFSVLLRSQHQTVNFDDPAGGDGFSPPFARSRNRSHI